MGATQADFYFNKYQVRNGKITVKTPDASTWSVLPKPATAEKAPE